MKEDKEMRKIVESEDAGDIIAACTGIVRKLIPKNAFFTPKPLSPLDVHAGG